MTDIIKDLEYAKEYAERYLLVAAEPICKAIDNAISALEREDENSSSSRTER